MKRIALSILLGCIFPATVHARSTWFEEGAIVGSSLGLLTANILVLTAVNCDPGGERAFCPGGRATASLLWGSVGSVGGFLIGGGIGALVKKPSYEVRITPLLEESRVGMHLMARW